MDDLIINEAIESEDEDLEPHERKKLKRNKAVDSSDEEEDEEDVEDLKDLIDDNPIEEESDGDSDDSHGGTKRKKSDDELDDRLEDEDYDLIEENLGVRVERKKFKRLKRIDDEESNDDEGEESTLQRDAIAAELFSDDESGRRHERSRLQEVDAYGDDLSDGEYSDADDFIVDDEGRPIADKRKKKKPIFTDAALQEAQETFGIDFEFDDFNKYEDEYEYEDEDNDFVEDEDTELRRRNRRGVHKKSTRKSIFEIYEPSELKRGFFTDVDNEIRNTDLPERMQLRDVKITTVPEDSTELDDEAEWIYKQAFAKKTVSDQENIVAAEDRESDCKTDQTIGKIRKALDFMRNQNFEVPFIAFYRKEYVLPELQINDLWKVYKFDAKWCALKQRKEQLITLLERMRDYQIEIIVRDPDAPIPVNMRRVRDEDIEKVKEVQTPEELKDVHDHFSLYYGNEVQKMQADWRAREKEERKRQKRLEKSRKLLDSSQDDDEIRSVQDEPEEDQNDDNNDQVNEVKYAIRCGTYMLCLNAGIGEFVKRFGLSSSHFADNLSLNYQRHEVEQELVEPLELAQEYVNSKFQTSEAVLDAAKFMISTQIAKEPLVKKCVREALFDRATITVRPTNKGMKEIDEYHSCACMKFLKNKPVNTFGEDMFLKLSIAEADQLITITINDEIRGNHSDSYLSEMKQYFIRDEFSKHVQEWNKVREECIESAMKKLLLPALCKELKWKLVEEAKEFVMKSCARKFYDWIRVAPYKVDFTDEDEDFDTSKGIRIMAIAYVPDYTQASFACLIGPDGDVTDYLRLPNLIKRKNSTRDDERRSKDFDLNAIKNFINNKKPHVVAIGGESREALRLATEVNELIELLVEEEQFPKLAVEIIDNELSKIYASSNKGLADFRDYPEVLREAVSIARRLMDPLVEFSQLFNTDDEILCLKFHSLQDSLTKEELLEELYLECVNRTNEVGVDINKAVQNPLYSNLLQFVCGLGPRKGQALIKILKQTNQRLENRTQLVTACHMGPKVFINCSGFIKIDTSSLGDSTEAYVEVLDGSRVHPETYEWARKMAVDALEYEDEDANPAGALEEILESPERLKDLDLDAFAEELERQGFGNKSITLYDIRNELNQRYKDLREPYQASNPVDLFSMLTKETINTFYVGKMILATVIGISHKKPQSDELDKANPLRNANGLWQCPFCQRNNFPELSEVWNHFDAGSCPGQAIGVRLILDNGVSGFIHINNLSDKKVVNPAERVCVGQVVHCRIIKIDVDKFTVDCTSKSSDLADKNKEWTIYKDEYYDEELEKELIRKEIELKSNANKQKYLKRVIVHPSFKNISFLEAEKVLQQMPQGEIIIRPSSKGADHLTVTWKVTEDIYQHIDVKEEGKTNPFSLGRILLIRNEEFEDLDEIIARHVTPMAAYCRDVLNFRYYRDTNGGSKERAEEILKEQQAKNSKKIHYFVSASKMFPGKFMLSYLPRIKCRHEFISVTPDGYKFRQQMFESLNSLFKWFKEHFRDPIPGTPAINSSTTSETGSIIEKPTYGSSSGGFSSYINTPYTPSGQTPFMTPYSHSGGVTPGSIIQASPMAGSDISESTASRPIDDGDDAWGDSNTTPSEVSTDRSSRGGRGRGRGRGGRGGNRGGFQNNNNDDVWGTSSNDSRGSSRGRGGRGGRGGGRGRFQNRNDDGGDDVWGSSFTVDNSNSDSGYRGGRGGGFRGGRGRGGRGDSRGGRGGRGRGGKWDNNNSSNNWSNSGNSNWDTSSTTNTTPWSKPITNISLPPPPTSNGDEENWDDNDSTSISTTPISQPTVSQASTTDQSWDNETTVGESVTSSAPKTVKNDGNIGNNESIMPPPSSSNNNASSFWDDHEKSLKDKSSGNSQVTTTTTNDESWDNDSGSIPQTSSSSTVNKKWGDDDDVFAKPAAPSSWGLPQVDDKPSWMSHSNFRGGRSNNRGRGGFQRNFNDSDTSNDDTWGSGRNGRGGRGGRGGFRYNDNNNDNRVGRGRFGNDRGGRNGRGNWDNGNKNWNKNNNTNDDDNWDEPSVSTTTPSNNPSPILPPPPPTGDSEENWDDGDTISTIPESSVTKSSENDESWDDELSSNVDSSNISEMPQPETESNNENQQICNDKPENLQSTSTSDENRDNEQTSELIVNNKSIEPKSNVSTDKDWNDNSAQTSTTVQKSTTNDDDWDNTTDSVTNTSVPAPLIDDDWHEDDDTPITSTSSTINEKKTNNVWAPIATDDDWNDGEGPSTSNTITSKPSFSGGFNRGNSNSNSNRNQVGKTNKFGNKANTWTSARMQINLKIGGTSSSGGGNWGSSESRDDNQRGNSRRGRGRGRGRGGSNNNRRNDTFSTGGDDNWDTPSTVTVPVASDDNWDDEPTNAQPQQSSRNLQPVGVAATADDENWD